MKIFLSFMQILISVIMTIHILAKRRDVSTTIAWLSIIWTVPIVGCIIWFLFETRSFGRLRLKRAQSVLPMLTQFLKQIKHKQHRNFKISIIAESLFKLCEHTIGVTGIISNNAKLFTKSSDIFKKLILDIQCAKHTIEMVFYIWLPGGLVDNVSKALIEASKRGVFCRIMLDSAGSKTFFRSRWHSIMKRSGIKIIEVLKVDILNIFLRRIDIRQHKKIILLDNCIAWTGSMNMIDPFFSKKKI